MLTNFPNGVSSFGIPQIGGSIPSSLGTYYFVDATNGVDTNDGLSPENALKTVKAAYDKTTTNNNDVILLSAYDTHTLTAMLTVSKNRVHFVGMGPGFKKYGQRTKVYLGVTTAATDIAVVKSTGIGNSFTNIKFYQDNTKAEALSVVAEGGEYATYVNCEFYRSTLLNGATSAELLLNGDSSQFYNCTFGSMADAVVGDVIHPCVRLAKNQVSATAVCRDCFFESCLFWRSAGGTTTSFIHAASATDIERMLLVKNSEFINSKIATATPAVCVSAAATLTVGNIMLKNCSGFNVTKLATATGVLVDGAATNSGTGVAVNAA